MIEYITNIVGLILVGAGVIFMLIGSIGIIKLPDFYSRSHATSKSDTLGIILIIGGLIIFEGLTLNSLKLFFIIIFIFIANPTGAHALGRAAFKKGLLPHFLTTNKNNEDPK